MSIKTAFYMLLAASIGIALFGLGFTGYSSAFDIELSPTARIPREPMSIGVENASSVQSLATFGYGQFEKLVWSPNEEAVGLVTSIGVWLFDTHDLRISPQFLGGHIGRVAAAAFSEDGTLLASLDRTGELLLWSVATGEQLRTLQHRPAFISHVAFDLDSGLLRASSWKGAVEPLETQTWKLQSFSALNTDDLAVSGLSSGVFSPNGRLFAEFPFLQIPEITVWDIESKTLITTLPVPDYSPPSSDSWIETASFSDDTTIFAFGRSDTPHITVWEVETGSVLWTINEASGGVSSLTLNGDGTLLAYSGLDQTIQIWDVQANTQLAVLDGFGQINELAFSPTSAVLVVLGEQRELRLIDVNAAINGQYAENELSMRYLPGHNAAVEQVRLSSSESLLISRDHDTVRFWNIATGAEVMILEPVGNSEDWYIGDIDLSPDGRYLAVANLLEESSAFQIDHEGVIQLFDLAAGIVPVSTYTCESRGVGYVIAFSPDGNKLAISCAQIHLWDWRTGEESIAFWPQGGTGAGAFSPNGTLLGLAGLNDKSIRLWDVRTGTLQSVFEAPSGVHSLSFHPSDDVLAVDSDGAIRLIDVTTGAEKVMLGDQDPAKYGPLSLAFNPNGSVLAAAYLDGIRLWDVANNKELTMLTGHVDVIDDVTFGPNGWFIASAGGYDGTVRLWGLAVVE